MNVEILSDAAQWDAFVVATAESSNYHRWGWRRAIEQTFGHEAFYLAAIEGDEIRGVLPLFRMNSRMFGRFLVSMPFFSYGGVLATDQAAREALLSRAIELGRELEVSHVELRQGIARKEEAANGWRDVSAKVTMVLPLPRTTDALWKSLSSGMRNKVRNAQRNGFRIEWGGAEAVGTFYRVFSRNMRNLGTPVYPQRWFGNLCKEFPKEVRILSLFDGETPVASGLVTCYGDAFELPWSATVAESRKKYSAVFLYWTLLEWAIQNGFQLADFGRCTRGGGVWEFKRHWNSEERALHWHYWLAPGAGVPELRPDNPKFRMATEIWKRLPLTVANLIGPRIVRSIP